MRRWLHFTFLLLTASAFAYAPAPKVDFPELHQLTVSPAHPSGLFTTNAVSGFTNNLGSLALTDTHDAAGNLTQRVWRNA